MTLYTFDFSRLPGLWMTWHSHRCVPGDHDWRCNLNPCAVPYHASCERHAAAP